MNNKLRDFITTTYRTSKEAEKIDQILSETKLNVSFVAVEPSKMNIDVTEEQVALS